MKLSADILKFVRGETSSTFEAFHKRRAKRVAGPTFIRCSVNQSGCGYEHTAVYTSSGMEMRQGLVQIEIDQLGKMVRLRVAPEGETGCRASKGGLFGGSKDIFRICGTFRIPMSLNTDGWWYGRLPSTTPRHKGE